MTRALVFNPMADSRLPLANKDLGRPNQVQPTLALDKCFKIRIS